MIGLSVELDFLGPLRALERGEGIDRAAFAHRAETAGADRIVVLLTGEDGPGLSNEEAARIAAIVERPLVVALRGIDRVAEALALSPAEVLLQSDRGGPLEIELGGTPSGALQAAVERIEAAGAVAVFHLEPVAETLMAAQDAGASVVELDTRHFAAAASEDEAVFRHRALAEAARVAGRIGLRVRCGGGAVPLSRLGRLAEIPEMEHVRVGSALLPRSFYEGIAAAVAAARDEIERGERRGARAALEDGAEAAHDDVSNEDRSTEEDA